MILKRIGVKIIKIIGKNIGNNWVKILEVIG
jgi:hypothetical protein